MNSTLAGLCMVRFSTIDGILVFFMQRKRRELFDKVAAVDQRGDLLEKLITHVSGFEWPAAAAALVDGGGGNGGIQTPSGGHDEQTNKTSTSSSAAAAFLMRRQDPLILRSHHQRPNEEGVETAVRTSRVPNEKAK